MHFAPDDVAAHADVIFELVPGKGMALVSDPEEPPETHDGVFGHSRRLVEHNVVDAAQTLAGRATHQALTTLFASAAYQKLSNPEQTKAIQKAITDARAVARAQAADTILAKATTPDEVLRVAKTDDH